MSANLKYTKDHEWLKIEDGNVAVVGITEYAQDALGDLVFVELPDIGATFNKGDDLAVVESVKTAAEVYAPVTGEVVAVNSDLPDNPELIKESLEAGWIAKIKMTDETDMAEMMDDASYKDFVNGLD